jgi:carbonic anhydrase
MQKIFKVLSFYCALSLNGLLVGADHFVPDMSATSLQNSEQVIQRSLSYAKGHEAFSELFFHEHEEEFVRLVKEGQTPKTLFISCSDSRVIPEFISGAKPGQLFVIRNAGNFVPTPDSSIPWDGIAASIEYGVKVLGVEDIIVCGHSHCGAIQALFYDPSELKAELPLAAKWLQFGEAAKKFVMGSLGAQPTKEERYAVTERISVLYQLDHLLDYPFIKKAVTEKKVFLHGWHFDIEKGEITYFNPKTYEFVPLRGLLSATK